MTHTEGAQKKGVKSLSTAEVHTNSSGIAKFAVIPTGNKLYEPAYAGYNVSDHVGNYSLYFQAYVSGSAVQMVVSGNLTDTYYFNLTNMTARQPTGAELNSVAVIYQNTFVKQVVNFVYQAFSAASKWFA